LVAEAIVVTKRFPGSHLEDQSTEGSRIFPEIKVFETCDFHSRLPAARDFKFHIQNSRLPAARDFKFQIPNSRLPAARGCRYAGFQIPYSRLPAARDFKFQITPVLRHWCPRGRGVIDERVHFEKLCHHRDKRHDGNGE